jgi:hypothetical protein
MWRLGEHLQDTALQRANANLSRRLADHHHHGITVMLRWQKQ